MDPFRFPIPLSDTQGGKDGENEAEREREVTGDGGRGCLERDVKKKIREAGWPIAGVGLKRCVCVCV